MGCPIGGTMLDLERYLDYVKEEEGLKDKKELLKMAEQVTHNVETYVSNTFCPIIKGACHTNCSWIVGPFTEPGKNIREELYVECSVYSIALTFHNIADDD